MMNMMPNRYKTSILFLLCILTGIVRCQHKYDCRRLEDCQNGGTCTNGVCACAAPYGGYNCEHDTTTICSDDPGPCKNAGTCYTVGGNNVCACLYGFYGTNCGEESVSIKCEGGAAEFSLAFRTEFSGNVKLNGTDTPSECNMTETDIAVPDNPDMKQYTLKVDLTEDDSGVPACKLANIVKTTDNQTQAVRYTGLFRVSYIAEVTTSVDELYNLTCSHEQSNITVSKGLNNVDVVSENLTVVGFNKTYSPVELSVLDKDDNELTSDTELFVGDIFQLHIHLTDTSVYTDVRIESCTTNNTKNGGEAKLFKVFDKGCPTNLGKRLTSGQVNGPLDRTIDGKQVTLPGKKLPIEAFKFVDSNDIGIVCTAKVCKTGDSTCAVPTDCDKIMNQVESSPVNGARIDNAAVDGVNVDSDVPPADNGTEDGGAAAADGGSPPIDGGTLPPDGGAPPADGGAAAADGGSPPADESTVKRRKKRAADDVVSKENGERTVSTVIRVLGPNEVSTSSNKSTGAVLTVERCLAKSEITATVAVLGAVVLVLLIACFILICKLLTRQQKITYVEHVAHHKTDRFYIPRAHVNDSFMKF